LLGEYLMAAYFSHYLLLPVLAITIYRQKRYADLGFSVSTVCAVYLFCYLCFILFPVHGPFFLSDPPDPERMGWIFPGIAQSVVALGASPGATFPSSHVAAAVVMLLLVWRHVPLLIVPFTTVIPGLVLGTVYGGFHYAVDAVAGVLVGTLGYLLGPSLWSWLGGPDLPIATSNGAKDAKRAPRRGALPVRSVVHHRESGGDRRFATRGPERPSVRSSDRFPHESTVDCEG
jgi:membrane-associated phospholipid phosphatase